MATVFETLNQLNVNDHTEKKKAGSTELTYLSWPWSIAEVKKRYPDFSYEVVKFDGLPYVYDPLTGYMVYTKVTIEGVTHEMWLPVMDGANQAMKAEPYTYKVKEYKYGKWTGGFIDKTVEAATMFDINKTIMRCLVKNLAMFGLGLYIYAGEDLPETEDDTATEEKPTKKPSKKTEAREEPTPEEAARMEAVANAPIGIQRAVPFQTLLEEHDIPVAFILSMYSISSLEELTERQAGAINASIDKIKKTNAFKEWSEANA